jgi:hypothetical protein
LAKALSDRSAANSSVAMDWSKAVAASAASIVGCGFEMIDTCEPAVSLMVALARLGHGALDIGRDHAILST